MSNFLFATGARAAESSLLEAVQAEVAETRRDPARLARPLLIVVPSRELRDHVAVRLAHAGATLGVEVLTLHALALRLHRAAGRQPQAQAAWVEVLARRAADEQPELRARLAGLQDGMGLAAASIRDLLSADALEGDAPIVQAARATAQAMQAHGVQRPGDLQQQAALLVGTHLEARGVLVHGFADATGQALSLLRALVEAGARVVIDLPGDPAAPDQADRGWSFAADFVRALGGAMPEAEAFMQASTAAAPSWTQHHAAGAEDEVRDVAQRILRLLADGVPASEIGVVARTLGGYALPVRRWFGELGVPFRGGLAPASLFPIHRKMQAVLAVLRDGADAAAERWLDAVMEGPLGQGGFTPQQIVDLRLAFRALGLGRLGQVAAFDAAAALDGREHFPLPVRRGLIATQVSGDGEAAGGDAEEAGAEEAFLPFDTQYRAHRRVLPQGEFIAAFGAAASLVRRLQDWPTHASLAEHAAFVERLMRSELHWRADGYEREDNWVDLVQRVGEVDLGACMRGEFLLLLEREARSFGARALGGESGVAVLDLTQARACTFEHLFVLGLNRGVFPRVVQSDPVLGDGVRAQLRELHGAAALQLAERGHGEERYLFAQLASAAPQLHLSWLRADEEGKELPPSSLLQRLWLSESCPLAAEAAVAVPRLRVAMLAREGERRTEREQLVLAGLRGDRAAWHRLMPQLAAPEVAAARQVILEEVEPDRRTPEGQERWAAFSPWSGLLGESLADPGAVAVTRLERFAGCGWNAFLSQHLHLEPAPDPLADLPDLDAALLGSTVHRALETLLAGPEAAQGKPRRVARPEPDDVLVHVDRAAFAIAHSEELRAAGLIQALAQRALPLVMRALELEFAEQDTLHVRGCEEREEFELTLPDGGVRRISFLADRVDVGRDGAPVYVDYKTSRPPWTQKAATRAKHLATAVLRGERLQVAAYAAAQEGASGRYLFLRNKSGAPDGAYAMGLAHEDPSIDAFRQTGGELLAAREAGLAFPRMEKPNGKPGRHCAWCELAEACSREDSGARRRLMEQLAHSDETLLAGLWSLPARKTEDEG